MQSCQKVISNLKRWRNEYTVPWRWGKYSDSSSIKAKQATLARLWFSPVTAKAQPTGPQTFERVCRRQVWWLMPVTGSADHELEISLHHIARPHLQKLKKENELSERVYLFPSSFPLSQRYRVETSRCHTHIEQCHCCSDERNVWSRDANPSFRRSTMSLYCLSLISVSVIKYLGAGGWITYKGKGFSWLIIPGCSPFLWEVKGGT